MSPLLVCIWALVSVSLTICQKTCVEKQIATFNTGLTHNVPDYSWRRRLIARELANVKADVLCLQEVWFESDIKLILDNVGFIFPYSWSALHYSTTELDKPTNGFWSVLARHRDKVGAIPCSTESSSPFVWCVLTRCAGSTGSAFKCFIQKCARLVFSLSQDCLTCMAVAGSDVCSTFSRCLGLDYEHNRINPQGLLLLSKSKIKSVSRDVFFPSLKQMLPRGYLQADIETVGSVVCTHLSESLNATGGLHIEAQIQAVLGITSWQRQQRHEINYLISNFHGSHMLVGDLNTGPEVRKSSVSATFPRNYGHLEIAGYGNDYITRVGACTVCPSNTLWSSNSSSIVDHVLVNGNNTSLSSRRILLSTAKGEPLSDHYGVQVGICNG